MNPLAEALTPKKKPKPKYGISTAVTSTKKPRYGISTAVTNEKPSSSALFGGKKAPPFKRHH